MRSSTDGIGALRVLGACRRHSDIVWLGDEVPRSLDLVELYDSWHMVAARRIELDFHERTSIEEISSTQRSPRAEQSSMRGTKDGD
jgi:hypothetical protein